MKAQWKHKDCIDSTDSIPYWCIFLNESCFVVFVCVWGGVLTACRFY